MTNRAPALLCLVLALGCSSNERGPGTPHPKHPPGEHGHGHKHGHGKHGHGDHATVHHRFDDAQLWAKRFEDPKRDAWQDPARVLKALALKPDAKVADIGAATGYFPVRFAKAVPKGVVYGVDVEPNLVNYLNLRAHKEGLHNLVSLVCKTDDPCLPEPVDLVFVCNTYHHIGDRRKYFTALKSRLRPGGRLAIVDFRPGDYPVGPKDGHKLAAKKVLAELDGVGYRLVKREELKYQYVLVLEPR